MTDRMRYLFRNCDRHVFYLDEPCPGCKIEILSEESARFHEAAVWLASRYCKEHADEIDGADRPEVCDLCAREKAERERDEALELCQREVANANKTTTAALLMGAQTNEALKEARKALVWIVDHWPGPIVGGKICALLGRARWPDEHMAAVRAARGGAEDE